jgi:hypothetical protein
MKDLPPEVWGLGGVIVGAFLGAVAQIVADWLRRNHEKQMATRALREGAYADWMVGLQQVQNARQATRNEIQAIVQSTHEEFLKEYGYPIESIPRDQRGRTLVKIDQELLTSLTDTRKNEDEKFAGSQLIEARLRLCAPHDTLEAALAVMDALNRMVEPEDISDPLVLTLRDRATVLADVGATRNEFVRLAQRDLAITDIEPVVVRNNLANQAMGRTGRAEGAL